MTQSTIWRFDPKASYVVVGGLGGCGRAILRWMASTGATNIIIPSRGGVSAQAAKDVVAELEAKAVRIITTRCDVSVLAELSRLLQDCAKFMPPVKGCINAAMVLQVCCTHADRFHTTTCVESRTALVGSLLIWLFETGRPLRKHDTSTMGRNDQVKG